MEQGGSSGRLNLQAVSLLSSGKQLRISFQYKGRETREPIVLSKNFERSQETEMLFSAFLGILTVMSYKFLLMAEEVERVVCFLGHEIFRISTLAFIPYEVPW